MSKGNMLLGHARGKVGSLVFSRSNGKQVVRAKADVVKNPQTEAQMIQRIFLNTIAQAYSNMSAIADHSFEGLQKGQASMSYFMKKNLKALRERVANEIAAGSFYYEIFEFSPLGTDILVPNNYVISKGTLPKVAVVDASADAYMAMALDTNTYQGVLDKYGLQRGDQLTFCVMQKNSSTPNEFVFARVILDPRESDGSEAPLSTAFITDGAITKPNDRNEGTFTVLNFADGKVNFGFDADYCVAAAIIVSRKNSDDTWLRSSAQMTANESSSERYYSLQYCLDAIANGGITTESERYLNNAGVGTAVATPVAPFHATRIMLYNAWKNVPLNDENYEDVMGLAATNIEGTGTNDGSFALRVMKDGSQVGTDHAIGVDGAITGATFTMGATVEQYTLLLVQGGEVKQNLGTILYGESGD
ncbi:MAG: hypothetical protein J6T22_15235 [Bacteroidales bacterium]|nr:hypothetical protein [Bacteroidales bacterium]